MTIVDVRRWEQVCVDDALSLSEKRCVLRHLDNGHLSGIPAMMKPRAYIFEKKTFAPVDGLELVDGWLVRGSGDAYLFTQDPPGNGVPTQGDEGTDWVPKNDVRIYQPTPEFEAPLPKRDLIDFVD